MAKDKIIGAVVMVLGILIAIIYTMGSVVDLWFNTIGNNSGWDAAFALFGIDWLDYRLFTVLPLWIMVLLIAIIAIWIGYSMLTKSAHFAGFKLNAGTRSIRGIGRGISC